MSPRRPKSPARRVFDWIDWRTTASLAYEDRISRLAEWVVAAERSGSRYSLALPDQWIAAGRGVEHRHRCLRALALLPDA